ncbi:hypothetical protein AB0H00_31140 [Nocardia sp. NPDC023852]|uniref:hypothetical protein n=1 Tax=Nocardia sp. NPDC023852 TaxID=3154697 RepID=UPI0033E1AB65
MATPGTDGADCSYRLRGHGQWTVHGADEVAALYRALTDIEQRLTPRRGNRPGTALRATAGFPATSIDEVVAPDGDSVGELVATRTVESAHGRHTVTIGRPFPVADLGIALCPFRVDDRPARSPPAGTVSRHC